MSKQRPYKHTITEVAEMMGTRLIVLGTYASLENAIKAAQAAERIYPNETREIRLRNVTYRNRYAHGPASTWTA